jgi:hypothetical protein
MSSEAKIIGYCRVCGKALDQDSAATAEGTLYCTEHAPQAQQQTQPPPPQEPPSPYTAPPYHAAQPPPLPHSDGYPSPPLAFVLGLIPGVGAVYNGQYAKGLVHVVILGLIFSILGSGAARGFEPLFGVLIPCFWFYMAFEAYHTARKRREGQPVDEFSSLMHVHGRPTRFPVAAVLLIVFGALFLLDNLEILKIGRLLRYWPALLIVLGVYLLYERVTEARNERH